MDIIDQASAIEEMHREQALARQSARAPRGVSALFCKNIYCGVEIPHDRRAALPGVQLCIDCQKLKERGNLR